MPCDHGLEYKTLVLKWIIYSNAVYLLIHTVLDAPRVEYMYILKNWKNMIPCYHWCGANSEGRKLFLDAKNKIDTT